MLVPNRGSDVVSTDVVHGGHPFAEFAGSGELGDRFGADTAGQGGFTEAVVGVEGNGDGAAGRERGGRPDGSGTARGPRWCR